MSSRIPEGEALQLRTPCVRCGQPLAADFPRSASAARARLCPTCGEPQAGSRAAGPDAAHPQAPVASATRAPGARPLALVAGLAVSMAVVAGVGAWSWPYVLEWATSAAERDVERDDRDVALTWSARALRTEGISTAPESACTVSAKIRTDAVDVRDVELRVSCGDIEIFHGGTHGGLRCTVEEGPGWGFGLWEYLVSCGRPADESTPGITLDTRTGTLVVQSSVSRFEAVVRREDGAQPGEPIYAASFGRFYFNGERRFRGRSIERKGEVPFPPGALCRIRLSPSPEALRPCRAVVHCDEALVFGGFWRGFAQCVLNGAEPTLALADATSQEDGDPGLRLELDNLRATLWDDAPAWRVVLALEKE